YFVFRRRGRQIRPPLWLMGTRNGHSQIICRPEWYGPLVRVIGLPPHDPPSSQHEGENGSVLWSSLDRPEFLPRPAIALSCRPRRPIADGAIGREFHLRRPRVQDPWQRLAVHLSLAAPVP